MSDRSYRAAAIQFEPVLGAKDENVRKMLALTERAARDGARLIVLPEMATTGYCWHDRREVGGLVEPIPGATTERFHSLARRMGCYVVIGMPEVHPETGVFYNSAALIGPDGLVGVYRKIHAFISEPKWAKDGDLGLPVWETELGRIGILICADAEFIEPARVLALSRAEVLCLPTNWLGEKCPPPGWIARAWENGCYLVAANRYGRERGVQFAGGSCIIDPDGSVLDRRDTGDGIVAAPIAPEQRRAKSFGPGERPDKLAARRPALYDTLTLHTYLYPPDRFHGLYGHRPLPEGHCSRVAVVQFEPDTSGLDTNLNRINRLLTASAPGADLIVLPEYALSGVARDLNDARVIAIARDRVVPALTSLARDHDTLLVAGFLEQSGNALYSTALLVGSDGTRASYRKTHPVGAERAWLTPGDEHAIVDLPLGRVGMVLGSDLCFPELPRVLALDGCDLIVAPSGLGLPPVSGLGPTDISLKDDQAAIWDPAHFHLPRLRGMENECYLAFASLPAPHGVGWSGVFGPGREFRSGDDLIGPNDTGIVTREIDTTNPHGAVRAKETIGRRQPIWYDRLQEPEPRASMTS
jgi:predicted amidohydrolase